MILAGKKIPDCSLWYISPYSLPNYILLSGRLWPYNICLDNPVFFKNLASSVLPSALPVRSKLFVTTNQSHIRNRVSVFEVVKVFPI